MIRKVWFTTVDHQLCFEVGEKTKDGHEVTLIGYYQYEYGFTVVRVWIGSDPDERQIYCEIPITSVSHVFYKLGE